MVVRIEVQQIKAGEEPVYAVYFPSGDTRIYALSDKDLHRHRGNAEDALRALVLADWRWDNDGAFIDFRLEIETLLKQKNYIS